jgi:hypothetical protein
VDRDDIAFCYNQYNVKFSVGHTSARIHGIRHFPKCGRIEGRKALERDDVLETVVGQGMKMWQQQQSLLSHLKFVVF